MTEENNKVSYIKADDNRIINEACIRWAKKMDECIMVCTKSDGCSEYRRNLHRICKTNNPESYNKMIKFFE
jgi:hypothetical protein